MTTTGSPNPSPPSGAVSESDARNKSDVVVGSLCTGYGGLDLGLELALGVPVRHAWHVENDPQPSKILAARFPGVPNYGDVKTLPYAEMEPVDWLTAGYPCQPFSQAGKRLGEADARHLWPYVADTIGALRPRNVLLENVRGHLRRGLDSVIADLAALGYDASWGVVRASEAGAPHRRERIFVIATDATSDTRRTADGDDVRAGGRAEQRRPAAGRDGAHADGEGHGRDEGRPESAGQLGRPDAAKRGPAATDTRGAGLGQHPGAAPSEEARPLAGDELADHRGLRPSTNWGPYRPAVERWGRILGRPAPRPTEPRGRNGAERLSPRLNEWLMGLPSGWVTDVPGLTVNQQFTALGNGVVPQAAALAVSVLRAATAQEVAA